MERTGLDCVELPYRAPKRREPRLELRRRSDIASDASRTYCDGSAPQIAADETFTAKCVSAPAGLGKGVLSHRGRIRASFGCDNGQRSPFTIDDFLKSSTEVQAELT
jgi:hypothetical protein